MSPQQDFEGEDRDARAEMLGHLAAACRQISGMMEAGVDILRITQVVRSQVGAQDEDILRLCARIDFDLKQGRALSDALADEPRLFSPFAVTLVRQGEERNTLAQAFARVAQAIDTERAELAQSSAHALPHAHAEASQAPQVLAEPAVTGATQTQPNVRYGTRAWPDDAALERAEARWLRAAGGIGAGLLATSAVSEALALLGLVPTKWQRPLSRVLSAAVLAVAASSARQPDAGQDQVEEYQPQPVSEAPQVLGAPQESAAAPRQSEEFVKPVDMMAQEQAPNAVYSGAPREDEEEAPRQVRRPQGEEEFD